MPRHRPAIYLPESVTSALNRTHAARRTRGILDSMPSFATADADDSKRSRVKEAAGGRAASGGRKPVKQIIVWTGIICVIALLINWNVSRLQTTAKSGRGGGSVQSSVSAQGDSQCISPHKGDTPTAVCQAFCNEKFLKFHCNWCKCRACSFCPKGGEAIEEAAKSEGNASSGASNASAATSNLSAASAPPAAMWNANGSAPAASEGELGSLQVVGGPGGSTGVGASTEAVTDGNATAGVADASGAAATSGNNATVASEAVAGSEQAPAEASVTGGATAEAVATQASASGAAPPKTGQPAAGQLPQTPEEAGAAYAAVVKEEAGGEDALDEDFGGDGADLDAELLGMA